MSARPFAIALLLTAAATSVITLSFELTLLAALGTVFLLLGFTWKRTVPTLLAGCLLYVPLAVVLALMLPLTWSYFVSGLILIVICERITFEYDTGEVLGSPTGIDAGARSLVQEVSRAHARKISQYVALATLVILGSAAASYFTVYASELTSAAVLLMLVIIVYSTR